LPAGGRPPCIVRTLPSPPAPEQVPVCCYVVQSTRPASASGLKKAKPGARRGRPSRAGAEKSAAVEVRPPGPMPGDIIHDYVREQGVGNKGWEGVCVWGVRREVPGGVVPPVCGGW
jgi:hypothetical protein